MYTLSELINFNLFYLLFVFCRYLRLPIQEVTGMIIDSSIERMNTFCSYEKPLTKLDLLKMLGDQSGKNYKVFRDSNEQCVQTIAVGIFDCINYTWSLYSDNPLINEPLIVIPLKMN